jgi:AhpD family alkylhydroperoxidase
MSTCIEYWRLAPDEYRAMLSLQRRLASSVDARLWNLVLLRVSHINGCAFCCDLHMAEARKLGESERRLSLLQLWSETPFFSEQERAALAWAERLTHSCDGALLESSYGSMQIHFSERQIAVLTLAVAVMNVLNRIAVGLGRRPVAD